MLSILMSMLEPFHESQKIAPRGCIDTDMHYMYTEPQHETVLSHIQTKTY